MRPVNLEDMIQDVLDNMDYICCNCNFPLDDHALVPLMGEHEEGLMLVCCPLYPLQRDKLFRPTLYSKLSPSRTMSRLLNLICADDPED